MKKPDKQSVVDLRLDVQKKLNMGITAAQDYCAALVHTHRRSWQHWERGERKMHPAFWELSKIKVNQCRCKDSMSGEKNDIAQQNREAR